MNIATLKDKLSPYIEKASNAGKKALVFTEKQVQTTPIFLKTETEYADHINTNKRAIILAYNETHPVAHTIRMMMPIWAIQAWTDTASLRYIGQSPSDTIAKTFHYTFPIEMRVYYGGHESFAFHDIASIEKWWKTRCYTDDHVTSSAGSTSTDPLKNI